MGFRYTIKNRFTGELITAGKVKEYIEYIEQLHSAINKLEREVEVLRNTSEELATNADIESVKKALQQQIKVNENLQQELSDKNATIDKLQMDNLDIEFIKHDELNKLRQEKDEEISKMKSEIISKNTEIANKIAEVKRWETKYARKCSDGHKKSCTDEEIARIRKQRLDGYKLESLAEEYGVSVRTILRYTKDLNIDLRKKKNDDN